MNCTNSIEPLASRQTWMQARILVAGTTALSLATLSHGGQGAVSAQTVYPITPCASLASSSYQTTQLTPGFAAMAQESSYVARTELGRKLLELRARGIRSGMKLLTRAEINEEMARRRGESGK